jgi:hypothetical protein
MLAGLAANRLATRLRMPRSEARRLLQGTTAVAFGIFKMTICLSMAFMRDQRGSAHDACVAIQLMNSTLAVCQLHDGPLELAAAIMPPDKLVPSLRGAINVVVQTARPGGHCAGYG